VEVEEHFMHTLDKTAWEILNATADDWENLEQIYHMICFDLSAENYADSEKGAYYLRPAKGAPLLEEIADRIGELVESGLLQARIGEGDGTVPDLSDRSYVWRAWFTMTPVGRSAWASSDHAKLVEQGPR
jgi:hypothetical protein